MLERLIRPVGAARLHRPDGGGTFAEYGLAPGISLFLSATASVPADVGGKASHRLLRHALSTRHRAVRPGEWRFARSGWGQLLIEQPGDLSLPRFSLSAADGIVAVTLADDGAVGVDVETMARVALNASPRDSWLSREEQDDLAGITGSPLTAELACRWTLKEALGKADGVGLVTPGLLTICASCGHPIVTAARPVPRCSLALFGRDDLIIGVARRPARDPAVPAIPRARSPTSPAIASPSTAGQRP